jgi:hypothetical protein
MKKQKPQLRDNQIRGRIASLESELGALAKSHDEMVKAFNETVAVNQKKHAELTGGIAALKALLPS